MATPDYAKASFDEYGYSHIAANGTTVVKSVSGILRSVTVNTKGTAANTVTVYDNMAGSGTVIAVIDSTVAVGTFRYDVVCGTGLTVVVATGVSADITVSYA